MSSKPEQLCAMEKGKAVSAQKYFSDTWNWAIPFIDNIKGDADNSKKGYDGQQQPNDSDDDSNFGIHIDKKVDDHPVIRWDGIKVVDNDDVSHKISGKKLIFRSGDSSNVKVRIDTDEHGGISIAFDVYYV